MAQQTRKIVRMTPETKGRLEKSSFEGFPVKGRRRHHAKISVRQRLYAQRLSNITKNGVFDVKCTYINIYFGPTPISLSFSLEVNNSIPYTNITFILINFIIFIFYETILKVTKNCSICLLSRTL